MNICICGWYYLQEFYNEVLKTDYKITIISHKNYVPEFLKENKNQKFSFTSIENIGLEFGAYNYYLNNYLLDDTIFLHDDTLVTIEQLKEIENKCKGLDQAYIFKNQTEQTNNGGKHGRCIYMSKRFLEYLKINYGIPYDERNTGYNGTTKNTLNIDFNEGIYRYHRLLGRIRDKKEGWNILNRIHIQNIKLGKRGKIL